MPQMRWSHLSFRRRRRHLPWQAAQQVSLCWPRARGSRCAKGGNQSPFTPRSCSARGLSDSLPARAVRARVTLPARARCSPVSHRPRPTPPPARHPHRRYRQPPHREGQRRRQARRPQPRRRERHLGHRRDGHGRHLPVRAGGRRARRPPPPLRHHTPTLLGRPARPHHALTSLQGALGGQRAAHS